MGDGGYPVNVSSSLAADHRSAGFMKIFIETLTTDRTFYHDLTSLNSQFEYLMQFQRLTVYRSV
jgi:hypothetical protein